MNVSTIAGVLRGRAQLRTHDGSTRERVARSPRELHRGLETAPLAELPVVTKAMLMKRFDELGHHARTTPKLRPLAA